MVVEFTTGADESRARCAFYNDRLVQPALSLKNMTPAESLEPDF